MKLYVVRHGETDWNKKKFMQGNTDVSLNETGVSQAKMISEKLKDVIEYLDRYFKIQYYQTLAHAQLNPAAADTVEKLTQQLNSWLEEEV
jgi:broad specificity phosphatase PhoE